MDVAFTRTVLSPFLNLPVLHSNYRYNLVARTPFVILTTQDSAASGIGFLRPRAFALGSIQLTEGPPPGI